MLKLEFLKPLSFVLILPNHVPVNVTLCRALVFSLVMVWNFHVLMSGFGKIKYGRVCFLGYLLISRMSY